MTYPRNHDDISLDSSDEAIGVAVAASDQLRLFVEALERLEEEKKGIADDIRDKFAELKAVGFDVKTTRAVLRLRRMEKNARDEAEALLDTYKSALGL